MYAVFLTHLFFTLFMLGLIWFVQIIHYPLLSLVKREEFSYCESQYVRRITALVALPMLIEFGTGWWLLWKKVLFVPDWLLWTNVGLLTIIWLSSFCLQVPIHIRLFTGYDKNSCHNLVNTNWIRTIAWSLRSLLLIHALYWLLN